MQVPHPDNEQIFFHTYPFERDNENNDELFCHTTLLINHLDSTAIRQVEDTYTRTLTPGSRILDLIWSWVSHIPESLSENVITGPGFNDEELKANPQLNHHLVLNLNKKRNYRLWMTASRL